MNPEEFSRIKSNNEGSVQPDRTIKKLCDEIEVLTKLWHDQREFSCRASSDAAKLEEQRDIILRQNDELVKLYKALLEDRCIYQSDFTLWHGKLLDLMRDHAVERQKCPACRCEHNFTTIKSHCDAFDYEGPCSACGQER